MNAIIQFGTETSAIHTSENGMLIDVSLPVLKGDPRVELCNGETLKLSQQGSLHLLQDDNLLFGASVVEITTTPEDAASVVYKTLLENLEDYQLLRIWNYVPHINATNNGLENYRSFCVGRANEFQKHNFAMPSASGVGITGNKLVMYFIAVREPIRHWENPEQVPAYRYPNLYGPKSPSFARASNVEHGSTSGIYVSGTASIKGHESVHIGDLAKQLETTLDNLRIMKEQVLGKPTATPLFEETSVYLRNPEQLDALLKLWEKWKLPHQGTRFLHSDICRSDLLIEIETHRNI